MKITFAGYQSIMMRHAGPTTHIIQIKKHLEKLGVKIELLDMWKTQKQIFNTDLFHIHGSYIGSYDICNYCIHIAKILLQRPFFIHDDHQNL